MELLVRRPTPPLSEAVLALTAPELTDAALPTPRTWFAAAGNVPADRGPANLATMLFLVLLLGLLIGFAGLVGIISPAGLMGFVSRNWLTPRGMWLAVLIRIGMGVLLILASDQTRFPGAIFALGWLTLAAGIILAFVGHNRMLSFVRWWMDRQPAIIRFSCLFALAFGGFIAYAAI